jgi:uncharacterized protein (TIGR02145 family)
MKTLKVLSLLAYIGMLLTLTDSCKKEDSTVPVLTTSAVSNIAQTTATCSSNVSSDGGAIVWERGVCWNTGQTPSIPDKKTFDSTGVGSFTSAITGLIPNTTYYVRAYATNRVGTGYGNVMSFKTLNYGIETDIDGNIYKIITIGTQIWMVENLNVIHYRNGDPITNVTDNIQWSNLTTGAYCDYGNSPGMSTIYGRLYNWYTVVDPRNFCPAGWHVPIDAEWTTLTSYLGGDSSGDKLKETGTNHWLSPNTGATNESCFTALPGGYRIGNNIDPGTCINMGYSGSWWSSTERDTYNALYWSMYNFADNAGSSWDNKRNGLSVRCVKD